MEKLVFLAVDGSLSSGQALEYVALLFANQPDIHFHLATCVSGNGSIMPTAADNRNSLLPESVGVGRKRETALRYLQQAADKLIRLHIAPERIHDSVEASGQDVAAAIRRQSEQLRADSILVGRRGLNTLSEMLLGSVSAALLKKSHEIPLWIIDGEVRNRDFLVPVDGSLPSLLAIDHLAHILEGRDDLRLYLFHCHQLLGKRPAAAPQSFYHLWEKEWCDRYLSDEDHVFRGPTQLLLEAGIPAEKIIPLPETTDIEAAHSIIRQAHLHQCGTIVFGRRGDGTAKGLLGGVSDRTLKHAGDLAFWLVG